MLPQVEMHLLNEKCSGRIYAESIYLFKILAIIEIFHQNFQKFNDTLCKIHCYEVYDISAMITHAMSITF